MHTPDGDWYTPKPRRGILTGELGRGRRSVIASLAAPMAEVTAEAGVEGAED